MLVCIFIETQDDCLNSVLCYSFYQLLTQHLLITLNQSFVLLLIVLSTLSGSVEAIASPFQEYAHKQLHQHSVAGASIVVVENGEFTEQFFINNDAMEVSARVTQDTVFQAASISKPVTAWLALSLVEDGLISLDEPVQDHLTRWQFPKGRYDGAGINLRQLLSHTAGLSVPAYAGMTGNSVIPEIEASLNGQVAKTLPLEIVTQPGQQWAYSGGGYTLVQLLIEELSGMSFADYAQQKLFTPLGMNSSSFMPSPRVLGRLGQPHGYSLNAISQHRFIAKAAAGLHTTAADLAKFALANMRDNPILSSTLKDLMHTPVTQTAYGEMGLGFFLKNNSEMIGHSGANFGWRAQFEFNPDKKIALIVMTNSETGALLLQDLMCFWANREGLQETNKVCAEAQLKKDSSRTMFALISYLLVSSILLSTLLLIRRFMQTGSAFSWPTSAGQRVAVVLVALLLVSIVVFLFTPLGAWLISGGFTSLFATIHYLPIGSAKVAILGLIILGLVVVRMLISRTRPV